MGDKYYKPVLQDDHHLVRSKDNPDRVRGLSCDKDNKNQQIIEFEEVELEDSENDCSEEHSENMLSVQLIIGTLIGIAVTTVYYNRHDIADWLKYKAIPYTKSQFLNIKNKFTKSKEHVATAQHQILLIEDPKSETKKITTQLSQHIDSEFERFSIGMSESELNEHIISLMYHMISVIKEIHTITNAVLKENSESEELYIERKKEMEKLLSEVSVTKFNQLLSDEQFKLDENTSKKLFKLLEGGVHQNGSYIPIKSHRINELLTTQNLLEYTK